jgi:hypothetical protein
MSLAGVVLLTRHGDRQGFYQSPTTYTASDTALTVLGNAQEYQNGQDLRNRYFTNNAITGLNTTIADYNQIQVMADAGGEGTVIVNSAQALMQGLYPPTNDTITLANGTQVTWSNAQLIQIDTLADGDTNEYWVEGYDECNKWQTRLNTWYNSTEFKAQAKIANPFYQSMSAVLGDRPYTLQNAWNLFDYLNVESIHNETIAAQVSPQQLAEARYWANYHEAGSFSDPNIFNIGNVAGHAILPPIIASINEILNASNPLKFSYIAISYKPFLSLATLWDLPSPLNNTVVDYASAAILEVYTNNSLAFFFRNGTTGDFINYPLFNSGNATYPIEFFMDNMDPFPLNTLSDWCNACGTTDARGCDTLAALNGTGGAGYASITSTEGRHHVSPVVAGVIGAMVTLGVAAIALLAWLLLSSLFIKRRGSSRRSGSSVATRTGSDLEQKQSSINAA